MNYQEAMNYLEQLSKYGSVPGLDAIRDLLHRLDDPQKKLQFVHIAGTNGKGSILAYLTTILQEAGYKTGRYISPTVTEYRERFQINAQMISEEDLAEITIQVKQAADEMVAEGKMSPTSFEIETAMAFLYFLKHKCDIVVIETGLGGRLDATNIIENVKTCVFASISRDHMAVLGNTLEEIADEKAGIIKSGAQVVSTMQVEEVTKVLCEKARKENVSFTMVDLNKLQIESHSLEGQRFSYKGYEDLEIRLLGKHQLENACTAIEAIQLLNNSGLYISDEAMRRGLLKTVWPGRFQVLQKAPLIVIDGAHNIDAIRRLVENIEIYLNGKEIIAIMGIFKDKEYSEMIQILSPYLKKVFTVDLPNTQRTLEKEKLADLLHTYGVCAEPAQSAEAAIEKAVCECKANQVILGCGSLSYLGEMIRCVEKRNR